MTETSTLVKRLGAAVGRLRQAPPLDLLSVYRFARAAYWWVPLPAVWKRRLAGNLFTRVAGLREARLLVRASIGLDDKVLLLSRTARDNPNPKGLLAPARRRLLVVERHLPAPDRTSGAVRLSAMLSIIAREGWEITFVSAAERDRYHWIYDDVDAGLRACERRLEALGAKIVYGPQALVKHLVDEGGTYLCALLVFPEIMAEYAPLMRAYAPNATLVYDTVDLHAVRFAREAELGGGDDGLRDRAERYDRLERANIDGADVVIAITPGEQALIERRQPHCTSIVVPNIHTVTEPDPTCRGRQGLVFIGHYGHSPNVDAMCHFVRDILPELEKLCGDVELFMLGSSMTDAVRALASTTVHAIGFVDDPAQWFGRARVFVAPLRYGAGMKGKIGHAMSHGLPVVTTSVGAEGMDLEPEANVLVADDAAGFARAVARLIEDDDLWLEIARAGRDHVRDRFSEAAAATPLRRMLEHRKPVRRDDWSRP